ncbi:hypothetical protein TNCV_4615571 [Trichonephila clavipes]|nr:hypothetical protein TNCV_4615571 [Trichonephila clavipes]
MFYEQLTGRDASDLRIGRRKLTAKRLYRKKYLLRDAPNRWMLKFVCEYGSLQGNRQSEYGTRGTQTSILSSFDQLMFQMISLLCVSSFLVLVILLFRHASGHELLCKSESL